MSAVARLRDQGLEPDVPLRALAATGQLGYGILQRAFEEGLSRRPHFIGCDMGSVDPGPYYLGAGVPATAESVTRRDLRMVLNGAVRDKIPLLIGTAGTAGAAPHLDYTLDLIRSIAREDGLKFRLAVVPADIPRDLLKQKVRDGHTRPLGPIAPLTEGDVDRASHIVGQMGVDAFARALALDPDVIVTGRACDTAIFAAIPEMLGYPMGAVMHMAKIIECASICCVPGGRDAMLGTLEGDGFVLESMNPARAATPLSVAAHSLYEQADPLSVYEPEGVLHLDGARFEAVDERRTRVSGGIWEVAKQKTIKLEGSEWCGERAVLCCGSCDPSVIANIDAIVAGVKANVAEIVPPPEGAYELIFHVYGKGAVGLFPGSRPGREPAEVFILAESIAATAERAMTAARVTKQFLLHHGFPGRTSTGGNVAFPFTPPELAGGSAYRFSIYHLMEIDDCSALFPARLEQL